MTLFNSLGGRKRRVHEAQTPSILPTKDNAMDTTVGTNRAFHEYTLPRKNVKAQASYSPAEGMTLSRCKIRQRNVARNHELRGWYQPQRSWTNFATFLQRRCVAKTLLTP